MKSIKKLFTRSITAALVTACVSLAGLTGCSPAGSFTGNGGSSNSGNSNDNTVTLNRQWSNTLHGIKVITFSNNTIEVNQYNSSITGNKNVRFTATIIDKNTADNILYLKITNLTKDNGCASPWKENEYTAIAYKDLTKDSVNIKFIEESNANLDTIKNTYPLSEFNKKNDANWNFKKK